MAEDNNSLDDLLSGVRARQKKSGVAPSPPKLAPKKGLTPLEILDLPEAQRSIITHLSHQKQANLADLQQEAMALEMDQRLILV